MYYEDPGHAVIPSSSGGNVPVVYHEDPGLTVVQSSSEETVNGITWSTSPTTSQQNEGAEINGKHTHCSDSL